MTMAIFFFLNLYSAFNAAFHIQFRDSFNSEKQTKLRDFRVS